MNPLQSLINTKNNICTIWKNERSFQEKVTVLFAFMTLFIKYTFLVVILKRKIQKEKLFGQLIYCLDYEVLFWLFYEIFVKKEYHFTTKKEAPYIIDCGSNIGMSILFFKKQYPHAKIFGFEPDTAAFTILQKNVQENNWDSVTVHNLALSNVKGTTSFYSDAEGKGNLAMSIIKRTEDNKMHVKEIPVATDKLSSYITAPVDFLKLDVEGAEILVLEDLDETGKISLIHEMFIEYHYSEKNPKNKLSTILALLEKNSLNYHIQADLELPFQKGHCHLFVICIFALHLMRSRSLFCPKWRSISAASAGVFPLSC
ncbi:FkbM family methyltransferase [Candidatus Woesearchaeota archaeon]|nr:FkbM family methyltransferase [Candidatus Woesearchaeota archaeon]